MANPKMQDVLDQARAILQDEYPDEYRYPETRLLRYANDYVQGLRRDAPHLFLGALTADASDIAANVDFPLGWEYVARAAGYVAGAADLHEAEHAETGRAGILMGMTPQPRSR